MTGQQPANLKPIFREPGTTRSGNTSANVEILDSSGGMVRNANLAVICTEIV